MNASNFYPKSTVEKIDKDKERLRNCGLSQQWIKKISPLLIEWHSMPLDSVLSFWEMHENSSKQFNSSSAAIPLKFCLYNVKGWKSRRLEAIDLIHSVESLVCVFTEVGEQETTCLIPDYNTFYQTGLNRSGGVCIAVGKNLQASKVKTNIPNTMIVDIYIYIRIYGLTEPLRVIGIYWPSSQQRNLEDLSPYITNNTLVAGDFNATTLDWDSPKNDNRGTLLKKWIEENNLLYIKNTKNSSKRSSRNIDLAFTNIREIVGETLTFGTSVHWPILYTSNSVCCHIHSSFPITNWKYYEIILCLCQEFWLKLQELISLDDWYDKYIKFLSALKCRATTWKDKEKFRPALPESILIKLKYLMKIINNYYRKRRYDLENEPERILLRTLNREIQSDIFKYRSDRWSSFMEEIQSSKNKGEAVCWSHLGKIYKQESLPFSKLKVGDVVITDKKDISNELYEHYMEQFQPPSLDLTNINDMEIMKEFKEILKGLSTSTDEVEVTNTSEIKNAIRSIRPKKSAEFDNISNFIIKRLPPGHIQGLGNCFNLWLEECRMPNEWKLAKIITLNKLKGGVSKCDQTCPISLLAAHSKLYEKILLTRIRSWAESNHIIPKEQSGFRPNCLIPTRVLSVYQEVLNNMAANSPTLSIYFDYQKACDKVWHAALIVKFSRVNIPFTLLKTIWFWLSMREAVVVYGELSTRKFTISIGLPQGSCLSSYLFIVFHSDIVKQTGAFSTHIFSDDLNVLISAPLEKKLEPMLQFLELEGTKVCNNLYDYSKQWKQPINISKSLYQVFHTQINIRPIHVEMNSVALDCVQEFKYLGFTWTN
ncbi:unnamed protein product [Rotaria magnacalcarata]|uniref:Reverse transcriptase domain-containing protein n=2 Tax=Rotaria magnacalcarata TaxID=392030 RepID=A0A820A979_9BILA|nr:unnamed protein product [Rotaria magnacalcarata]